MSASGPSGPLVDTLPGAIIFNIKPDDEHWIVW